jgi:hypothetical protein
MSARGCAPAARAYDHIGRSPEQGMDFYPTTPAALLSALALAQEHGSATEALRATGLDLDDAERIDALSEDVDDVLAAGRDLAVGEDAAPLREALALGFLAGRIAHRPRPRRSYDPTSFLMDHDLLVRGAEGQSILRLPWFEEGLFVGRELPEISEMPPNVRALCVDNYRAAFAGQRRRFAFLSYGHAYNVDAVPVRAEDGGVTAVLAVATPALPAVGRLRTAAAHEREAEALEDAATLAEARAQLYRLAGDAEAEDQHRQAAERARRAAQRARAKAWRGRSEQRHTSR